MSEPVTLYEWRPTPYIYDALSNGMFLLFGGLRNLRNTALDAVGVDQGTTVLELGCGTGGLTALMTGRGAIVEAIDGSRRMLAAARRRAPSAHFASARLEQLTIRGTYDMILLAFVLHELDADLRIEVLRKSLVASRRIVILDHAVPAHGLLARAWRRLLLTIEPPSVRDCIERGFLGEIDRAGGSIEMVRALAGGTATLIVTGPA